MKPKALHVRISAIDTLMFRDGRPFNQADAGASEAVSVFPPYPPTIVGAVRAALWKHIGGGWPSCGSLGNGTNWQSEGNVLNQLSFGPPVLLQNDEPIFPVPLHVMKAKNDALTRLSPGSFLESDIGKVRLPSPDESLEGLKTIDGHWVSKAGMQAILNGAVPDAGQLIERDKYLWGNEQRVGIGIDRDTRTTLKAQLYMATHTRMRDDISLYVKLSGFQQDDKKQFEKTLQPLAGEHRMAEIKACPKKPVILPKLTTALEDGRYCIILLSPLVIDALPGAGQEIENLPGKVISACLGKPVVIGGWDSQGRQPIPLRQCIPAGSVWFMRSDRNLKPDDISGPIGKATEWGFGQILIGKWHERHNP